ncbi:hypothetical protein ABPG74_005878 [Tetrahymena malaccensis]
MAQNNYSICVVGSGSFDLFLLVNHFPVEGETLQANDSFIKNGGKGANQAVAAAKLGAKTIFAGQFGQDKYGDGLVEEMSQAGVDMSKVRRLANVQTGQAIITLNKKGENSIIIVGGANTHYDHLNVLPQEFKDAIQSSRITLLQKEIPLEISKLAAIYAKQHNKLVMLDCGGRDEDIPEELLQNIDFISPNQSELKRVMNINSSSHEEITVDEIRQQLLSKYPNLTVVLKEGSKGSAVITKTDHLHVDSASLIKPDILNTYKIVDTTGAGDCFTAAFCVEFDKLFPQNGVNYEDALERYKKCLLFANCSAFVCITVMGAMPSMPKLESVQDLLSKVQ